MIIKTGLYFTDLPYCEGKKVSELLTKEQKVKDTHVLLLTMEQKHKYPLTIGSLLRLNIMKMPGVICLSTYENILSMSAKTDIDLEKIKDKIIELSAFVGITITNITYKISEKHKQLSIFTVNDFNLA